MTEDNSTTERTSRSTPTVERSAPPKARRPYHHGDLRRTLLDTALALVENEGVSHLTLREIARRAGVSHAAPYRHFADKAALLAAVAEEGFQTMRAALIEASDRVDASDALGRLRASGVAYVGFASSHGSHYRVMFGPEIVDRAAHPTLHEASQQTFRVLVDQIVEAQKQGALRGGPPLDLAVANWATAHGLSMLLLDRQLASMPEECSDPSRVLYQVIEGMLAKPVGAAG